MSRVTEDVRKVSEEEFYDHMRKNHAFVIMDEPNGPPPHMMRYFDKEGDFLGMFYLYHDNPQSEGYVPPEQREFYICEIKR